MYWPKSREETGSKEKEESLGFVEGDRGVPVGIWMGREEVRVWVWWGRVS